MGILAPLGLALGALAVPIILFYMLRLRRQEITVSSSLLWQQVMQDRQANAPWQKLRRNLLLLLQLLLLALLVLALARPFVFTSAPAAGNLLLILDASASMQATDGPEASTPTRWAAAQREATRLAEGLGPGERMTVIWAGPGPQIVLAGSGDRGVITGAVRGLRPGNGAGDLAAALTLAAGAAAQLQPATIVVISDGALDNVALPALAVPVQYVPVGSGGRNAAITGVVVRDAPGGPQGFFSLATFSPEITGGLLALRVSNGLGAPRLWDSRQVTLTVGSDVSLTFADLPLDTRLVTATLTLPTPDLLALDNTAWAVRATATTTNTLLVGTGNQFLERALALLPGVGVSRQAPADYKPTAGYALTVFDGYLPPTLPPGNLLLFNPPPSALVPMSGTVEGPVVGLVETADPLLRYADWGAVHIARAGRVLTPPWARPLVRSTAGDPLLLVGETEGHRIAVIPFDLHQSDLPLLITFPIQLNNLLGWLLPTGTIEAPARLAAGGALALHPRPDADRIVITTPDGATATLPVSSTVAYADTAALGLYTVRYGGHDAAGAEVLLEPPEYFAVNLFSRTESALAPRPTLPIAGGGPPLAPAQVQRPLEIWPWLLVGALALLTLEWWVYNRGRSAWPNVRRLWAGLRRG